jgi:hypothetical protein
MKLKTLAVIAAALALAASAPAQVITSFVNLDFDSGGVSGPFKGFDAPDAPEIIGWNNNANLSDAGVEASGAWWGTYQDKSAFMNNGGSAFNLSDYTIQSGDAFSIEFYAKCWWGDGLWTVSLFYDNPANVIGSYTTPGTTVTHWEWTQYATTTPIAATEASVGGKLGILFASTGPAIACFDETVVTAVVPEPTTLSLAAVAGLGLVLARRRKS